MNIFCNYFVIFSSYDTENKKSTPKVAIQKPIDKTKYFTDKENLKVDNTKQEEIKTDNGKTFFETINTKVTQPIDIEK